MRYVPGLTFPPRRRPRAARPPACTLTGAGRDLQDLRAQLEPLIRAATIRAVSEKSGVPAPNISDWLRGKSTITVETAERIAAAIGVELRAVQLSSNP